MHGRVTCSVCILASTHDEVIKWKHFLLYWPFTPGIHRSPVNPHTKAGDTDGALMFTLICAWIKGSVNNGEAGDLRCHRTHYDVTVMYCQDICRHTVGQVYVLCMDRATHCGLVIPYTGIELAWGHNYACRYPYRFQKSSYSWHLMNTLRPKKKGCHLSDDIFKCIFLNENV